MVRLLVATHPTRSAIVLKLVPDSSQLERLLTSVNNDSILLEKMMDVVKTPSTLEKLLSVTDKEQLPKIKGELISGDNEGTKLELEVAKTLIENGVDVIHFQKSYGPNGSTTEVDIETDKAIFEVTIRPKGKTKQIKDRVDSDIMNPPPKKSVILYAPDYGITAERDVVKVGGIVVRNYQDLLSLLKSLP